MGKTWSVANVFPHPAARELMMLNFGAVNSGFYIVSSEIGAPPHFLPPQLAIGWLVSGNTRTHTVLLVLKHWVFTSSSTSHFERVDDDETHYWYL